MAKRVFVCQRCGRCYELNGDNLTPDASHKMESLRKAWLKQQDDWHCCTTNYDNWLIKQRIK